MIRNNPYVTEGCGLVTLVTTPIGNRDDITLRALNFLKECDVVACEDTRNTSLLLSYYGIKNKKYISLYAQTEAKEASRIVLDVKKNNLKLAYCSDAGMPGISDPGALLVKACHENGVPVTLLPGPSASLTALVLSGIDSADFTFYGFLPTKDGQRKKFLESIKDRKETSILYESPKRIIKTLTSISEVLGPERYVSLIRELTKIHEEVLSGSVSEILRSEITEKGECVIIIEGNKTEVAVDKETIADEIKRRSKENISSSDLSKELSKRYRLPKKTIYEEILKIRNKK